MSNKLENVAGRIGQEQQQQQQQQQQQMQRQQQIMQRQMTRPRKKKVEDNNDRRTKSIGKSLDGEFHRKIKNVIDVLDEYDDYDDDLAGREYPASYTRRTKRRMIDDEYDDDNTDDDTADSYTTSKVIQLESRIRKMDKLLRSMEGNVNAHIEYVDQMVNQRLDDIEDDVVAASSASSAAFEGELQRPPPLPPPEQLYMEERRVPHPPLPPPSSSYTQQGPPPLYPPLPPRPLPPPSQESYTNPYSMDDDGRTYYQERNYNDLRPTPHILSQQARQSNSANEQSRGYHYNERNTSFISAFSKADNERRRQFQPFRRGGGLGQDDTTTARWNNNRVEPSGERLPGGVRYPPNRDFRSVSRPYSQSPSMLGRDNGMRMMQEGYFEEGPGGYFEEPYYYDEDRPMMMGGEDYLYDDNMFEY